MLITGAGARPTRTELSHGLLDVATTLYPTGPHCGGLWERSGGNTADIPTLGTGRDQWTQAIRAITKGSTGAPSAKKLLDDLAAMDWPADLVEGSAYSGFENAASAILVDR